jgi:hypothetical protein
MSARPPLFTLSDYNANHPIFTLTGYCPFVSLYWRLQSYEALLALASWRVTISLLGKFSENSQKPNVYQVPAYRRGSNAVREVWGVAHAKYGTKYRSK